MEEIEYYVLVNKDKLQFIGSSFDSEKLTKILHYNVIQLKEQKI